MGNSQDGQDLTDLSEMTITLNHSSYTYTGQVIKLAVTVLNEAGEKLEEDTDYTVTYDSGCKDVGTYYITITGKTDYTGTVTASFEITAQKLSASNVTLSFSSKTYTGSAMSATVTGKNAAGTTLTEKTDYTVSKPSGRKNAGTYTYTIAGIGNYTGTVSITGTGNYTGTITKTFKILPKKGTISSLKSAARKKMTVKWKKVSGSVTKYQVRYRMKGTSKWTTKTYSASTKSKTIAGLKPW